jgi:hypothetical protein
MRQLLLLIFTLACLLLSGCAVLTGGETANLPQTAERFTEAMRWKDWYGAAMYVAAQQRPAFLEQFKEDPDLFVVDSQVRNIHPGSIDGDAEVVYQLEYYRLPSSRVERWTWVQQWQKQPGRFAAEAVWLISNPPPLLPWNR